MKLVSLWVIGLITMFAIAVPAAAPAGSAPAEVPACAADLAIGPVTCGGVLCGKNQHCCNASCGKCAPIGVECPQIACGAPDEDGDAAAF